MWPMLLTMTRDECRRTLRRLELEAYSNMISVFRAQGPLEDTRKKLLEELRAVLHISSDRHSAEARRVANDEILATIAEHISGPNTGLGWICEGRRRVPLMPRGVAQTMYTEMADKAAEIVAAENKEYEKKIESEKLLALKTAAEEASDAEGQTADSIPSSEANDEWLYPPVAMEDQTIKLWETELITRKRKISESTKLLSHKRKITETSTTMDDPTTPVKNMRNIPANTNQRHLNLSQIYSKYSQTTTSREKPSGQSKHSYNQVSKVPTSKSTHTPRQPHKQRSHKQSSKNVTHVVSKPHKRSQEMPLSPGKQYNQPMQEYGGPPGTFQATYAKSILGNKVQPDYTEDMKPAMYAGDGSPPASSEPAPHLPRTVTGKACQLILKKPDPDKKIPLSDVKVLQKPSESIKVLSSRPVLLTPSSAQRPTGKFVTTKVIGSTPKSQTAVTPSFSEKMVVMSKPSTEQKGVANSKFVITSESTTRETSATPNKTSPKLFDALTPKGIPATDLKVSAKAVVLNSKSGQKMVVLPAKGRTKLTGEPMPRFHFKGIPTAMKLVPVGSQPTTPTKSPAVAVVSKPSVVSAGPKILGVEPIKTANLADIVPVKGLTPITTPKITHPIVRPANTKGGVIVVQKGATIGKALTFTKNGNDMSKIIMGKNVNQLLQAKPEQAEAAKCGGNVIVLELNNEQSGHTTTMSEILDRSGSGAREEDKRVPHQQITEDTPVLFDTQMTEETCNAGSLDSTAESIGDMVPIELSSLPNIEKAETKSILGKETEGGRDSSSVTDWEMELETATRKDKDDDDKLNSLHLDLGMSSDSDSEFMDHKTKSKHSSQESLQRATPSGEACEVFSSSSSVMSMATRTLLSQLQDEGSSSNDSSFALKAKHTDKLKDDDTKIDKCESEELTKAREKLSQKVLDARSQQRRIDLYSTAITSTDITLDPFSYLEEGLMVGDDRPLPDSLSRLLETETNAGPENSLNKQ